jgi:hypothetical protein
MNQQDADADAPQAAAVPESWKKHKSANRHDNQPRFCSIYSAWLVCDKHGTGGFFE